MSDDPMPAQVRGAHIQLEYALRLRLPRPRARRPARILVVGTGGGSAMAGEALKRLLDRPGLVGADVCQDYAPPAWVGRETLVLAASHSGNTQEVLAALGRCAARGAQVTALAAGGRLAELARRRGWPLVPLTPGVMPRVLFYEILGAMLAALDARGLYPAARAELREAEGLLRRGAARRERQGRSLAAALAGRIPWIAGAEPATAVCALRFRNQLGENSKLLSVATALPRAHHDEIVGWGQPPGLSRRFAAVLLRDPLESAALTGRFEATRALLAGRAARVLELRSEGRRLASRILTLCQTLDFASVYLALGRGVAPTPVPVIDLLKRRMGQR